MILVDDIRGALSRKACIVGVGNTLLGDDGAGVVLVEALRCGGAGARVRLVNAEDIIESHAFEIAEGDWDRGSGGRRALRRKSGTSCSGRFRNR